MSCEAPAMRGRRACKGTAGFVSHTFVLRYSNLPKSVFEAEELSLRSTLFFKQIFEVAVTLRFHLFVRYKAQRGAVDTIPHAVWRFRLSAKHMPQVRIPRPASHFGSAHAMTVIFQFYYRRFLDWFVEGRPTADSFLSNPDDMLPRGSSFLEARSLQKISRCCHCLPCSLRPWIKNSTRRSLSAARK